MRSSAPAAIACDLLGWVEEGEDRLRKGGRMGEGSWRVSGESTCVVVRGASLQAHGPPAPRAMSPDQK